MVLILSQYSSFFNLFVRLLGIVPNDPIMIGMTANWVVHDFLRLLIKFRYFFQIFTFFSCFIPYECFWTFHKSLICLITTRVIYTVPNELPFPANHIDFVHRLFFFCTCNVLWYGFKSVINSAAKEISVIRIWCIKLHWRNCASSAVNALIIVTTDHLFS